LGTIVGGMNDDRSSSCLLRRLLGRLDLFRLFRTRQALTFGATTETIGLCLDQRGGVTLHPNTHHIAQRHHLRIRHSELLCELVYAHVLCQNPFQPFVSAGSSIATPTVGNSSMMVTTSSNAFRRACSSGWSTSGCTEYFQARSNALRRAAV